MFFFVSSDGQDYRSEICFRCTWAKVDRVTPDAGCLRAFTINAVVVSGYCTRVCDFVGSLVSDQHMSRIMGRALTLAFISAASQQVRADCCNTCCYHRSIMRADMQSPSLSTVSNTAQSGCWGGRSRSLLLLLDVPRWKSKRYLLSLTSCVARQRLYPRHLATLAGFEIVRVSWLLLPPSDQYVAESSRR